MKKLLALALAVGLAAFALSGCAGGGTESGSSQTAGIGQPGEKTKIVLLINGTLGDKSFFDSAQNGMKLIEEKYGDRVETQTVEMSYDATKWTPTLIEFSEDKQTDIIISGTWQMVDRVAEVAPDYPDKKYIVYDASLDYEGGKNPNTYSVLYKQNEAAYLAGAASAMVSKTNMFGFVGGMDNVTINDFLVGLIAGSHYVKPEMKFTWAYIGNFDDAVKAKEITLSQIRNQHADVTYGCAGQAGLGSIEAAAESKVYALGGDSDVAMSFKGTNEEKAGCIVTSVLKRVDNSLLKAVSDHMDGKLKWGTAGNFGLADQSVGLAKNEYYKRILTEEQQKQVDDIEQKIIKGELEVPTAFGMSAQQLEEYKNSAK